MEAIAKNTFVANEDRDPVKSSLFYFALRKRRLVLSLWKQSIGHQDRNNMVKFLNNDFDESRWRTAARKNAFALMTKQRFGLSSSRLRLPIAHLLNWQRRNITEFAAAMFLLGDSLRDAVNICLRQLDDFQLAIALARVYEGEGSPTLKLIVEEHVLPMAIGAGFRWLVHWSFWTLDRRDLAVRSLLVSLIVAPRAFE